MSSHCRELYDRIPCSTINSMAVSYESLRAADAAVTNWAETQRVGLLTRSNRGGTQLNPQKLGYH
ncbi:hypothetical protein GMOD_00006185 [Pyrenophora seminiperda CCB06]|uniref:Uncharacterized protein n=1 Tax=Pyrenophora seminiperda CCB06 TaxID=1302712 RepID=A0A3M7M4F7_9PLEO|nr:hypothetical protein GMOD_00006185 [Pyrenophora seminiperda CCB06]